MAATFDSLRSVFEKTMKTNEEDFGSVMKHAMTMSRRPNPADTLCELGRSEVVCDGHYQSRHAGRQGKSALVSLKNLQHSMSITMSKAVLDFKLFPDITAYFGGKLRVEYNFPKSFLVRAYKFALYGKKLGFLSVPSTLVSFMRVLINEVKEEDDAPATNLPSSDNAAGPSSPKRCKLHKQQNAAGPSSPKRRKLHKQQAASKSSGGPSSSRSGKPANPPIGRPCSPPSGRTCSPPARPPTTSSAQPTPSLPSAKPAPSPPSGLPGPSQRTPSAMPGPSQRTPSAMPGPSQRTPSAMPGRSQRTPSAKPAPTPVPQNPPQDPEDRRRATEELWKAVFGEDDRAVEAAVEAGADVGAMIVNGETPLHEAARRGREAAVLYLLSHGAELDGKGWYGETPLHYAACNGHLPCIKLLLERGADLNARTNGGHTPLALAVLFNHHTVQQYLRSVGGTR